MVGQPMRLLPIKAIRTWRLALRWMTIGSTRDISRPMALSKDQVAADLVHEWTLPSAATLGSSVRARGILLEMRAKLSVQMKRALSIKGATLCLRMSSNFAFQSASSVIVEALVGIESLPVIPREIQDILGISATERHRWLKDGRLPSAGTRTVKLRGRARKITFHVFDPQVVEDVLNRDLMVVWREDDAATATENRRRAAAQRALTRRPKEAIETKAELDSGRDKATGQKLTGWDEFERDLHRR